MLIADGICGIYTLKNIALNGEMPKKKLDNVTSAYYVDMTIGVTRLYAAKGANANIDRLIRIWGNDDVEIGDYVVLEDGKQYRIDAIQRTKDDGLKVNDLTLVRLEERYDVII